VLFLESALGREEEQATSESNQAKPTTSHRYWVEGGAAGQRWAGGGPALARACQGHGHATPTASQAQPSRTDSIQEEDGGAGVRSLYLDEQELAITPI
jgi:hypothetical protein